MCSYERGAAMEQWMHQHKAEIVELVRLEEVETLNDPEKEPYRSCYIARDILTTLLKSLEENETSLRSVASNSSTENELDLFIACQVALTLRRAANFNSTEERSEGIMIMESVLQKLATIPLLMQFCDLTIEEPTFNNFNEADKEKLLLIVGLLQQLLNTLGFVYGHVWGHSPENIRKAIHFLTNAKHLYNAYCRSFFVKGVVESDLPLQMIMEEDWSGPEYFMTLFQLDIRNISKEKSHSAPVEEKSVEVVNKEDKNGDAEDEKEVDESVADYEPFKRRQFQDNFTRTLFYLAQAYGKSPEKENKEKSAKYCYFTLHRQLNSMEYEPLEWSLNAATLSQYYHNNDQYLCAKHCLCAAEVILSEAYEDPLIADKYKPPTPDADGNISMEEEKWRQAWADIRRCWIKLGISLLSRSWQFNDQKIYEEVFGKAAPTDGPLVKFVPFNLDLSLVEGQRIPYVSCLLPESTTDKQLFSDVICLKTFDAARKVFLFIQKCIQEAHLFYKLDDQCSDAVALYQDHSLAYKELTHFEFSMERQCCMHKRRVDILRYLIKELNPKCWLMVHRQLIFELAETLNEMMSLKLTMHTEKPSPHLVNKSNTLGLECITAFEGFIETYLDSKGNTPERYPQDDERPVIVAKFHLARLYTRLIEKDKKIRLDRHVKSLEYYKSIVNYCDQYPTAKEQVKQEYDLAVEMCSLLPAKMASMVHAV